MIEKMQCQKKKEAELLKNKEENAGVAVDKKSPASQDRVMAGSLNPWSTCLEKD